MDGKQKVFEATRLAVVSIGDFAKVWFEGALKLPTFTAFRRARVRADSRSKLMEQAPRNCIRVTRQLDTEDSHRNYGRLAYPAFVSSAPGGFPVVLR